MTATDGQGLSFDRSERGDCVDSTLLITVDSLRADAVTRREAPAMATMAERGTNFTQAFAQGNWTPFSFPSILGGRHVFADGATVGVARTPTLAETLSDAGVETAGFNGANGFLTAHWGYDRGFDTFESFVGADDSLSGRYLSAHPTVQAWVQLLTAPAGRLARRLRGVDPPAGPAGHPVCDASRMLDVERRAVDFLDRAEGRFFLWLHYMDVHTPYVPAPGYVRRVTGERVGLLPMVRGHVSTGLGLGVSDSILADLRTLYDAAVAQVDESIGRVLDALAGAGHRDSTLVVLAGDHGEEFQEHGHLAHYPKLYDELVNVPFVVDHPDAAPRRVDHAVGLDAIPPTVCAAMGVSPSGFVGADLLPTVRDGAPPPTKPVTSVAVRGERITQQPIPRRLDEGELLVSARTAGWSYIYHTDSGRRELYDRRRDPTERRNVHDGHADSPLVDRLHAAVERRIDAIGTGGADPADDDAYPRETPDTAVPDSLATQLKALGYR